MSAEGYSLSMLLLAALEELQENWTDDDEAELDGGTYSNLRRIQANGNTDTGFYVVMDDGTRYDWDAPTVTQT